MGRRKMFETRINEYGKEKLKNLAKYRKHEYYPVIHHWVDRVAQNEQRKFIHYFAIPDDKGNTFIIPGKWCEGVRSAKVKCTMALDFNDLAIEQLNKAGTFSSNTLYPIIKVWEDLNPKIEDGKRKFDIFFSVLDDNQHVFIVQSTWGQLALLDKDRNPCYT